MQKKEIFDIRGHMATSGVKWEKSSSEISEQLINFNGKLVATAKHFKVHYETLVKKINEDPFLFQLVKDLRQKETNILVEECRTSLHYAQINRRKDLNNAIRAAIYVLDKQKDNMQTDEQEYASKNIIDIVPEERKNELEDDLRG